MSQSISNLSLKTQTEMGIKLTEIQEQILSIENYDPVLKLKALEEPPNPAINYVKNELFPILNRVLNNLLNKITENNYLYNHRNTFNATDYIAECLWNMNSRYPKRQKQWTYIFDIVCVKTYLETCPRPFYPLSLIWNKYMAATIVQKYVKGFLVRNTPEVQKFRKFWKEEHERKLLINEQNDNSIKIKADFLHFCARFPKCPRNET